MIKLFRNGLFRLLAVALCSSPVIGQTRDFEDPPVIAASSLAGALALVGEDYSVVEAVPTDGFMATYSIESRFGVFSASGPGMLAVRLNEIRALAVLEKMQNDERFKAAAEQTAGDTVRSLRNLAEHPKETLQGAPEGVGRFFNRTGRSIRTGLQKIEDINEGRLPGVGADSASRLPGGTGEPAELPEASMAEVIAHAGGDVAVNILGFDEHRRRLAKELAVDPYTTHPVLVAKLDEVTWAAFAGGLGVNVLTTMIPGGTIISASSTLTDWVWDKAPGDLRVDIEASLRSIGASQDDIDRFLRHHWYTLSMRSVLASSLEALDGVAGRAEVLPFALGVGSEGQARFVVQTVEMLKNHHVQREPLAELSVEGTVVGRTQTGTIVVTAPVDYLSWTLQLANFASQFAGDLDPMRIMEISGHITDRAREELVLLGWSVSEESELGPREYPLR